MVDASTVKELRERTGAGMMDCKRVLVETDEILKKRSKYLEKKVLQLQLKKLVELQAKVL